MRPRRQIALAVSGIVALTVVAALLVSVSSAPGSTLSREAMGWVVARRYVEERGVEVRLLDRLSAPLAPDEALFVVFPWQRLDADPGGGLALGHALRGGTVVVGYTGSSSPMATHAEQSLLEDLGVPMGPADLARAPGNPLRWREAQEAEWPLLPVGGPAPGGPARVRRMARLPLVGKARALFETPDGQALVSVVPRGRGRVILLPAEALANARLGEAGNAQLIETLMRLLPRRWTFDEYHHGLVAAQDGASGAHSERAFTLFFVHLAAVYLLALAALVRRFGPPWREPLMTTGSVRSFFVGIGALHARLGHQRQAASLLATRARELDPGVRPGEPLPAEVERDAEFVRYAQAVARAQKRRD